MLDETSEPKRETEWPNADSVRVWDDIYTDGRRRAIRGLTVYTDRSWEAAPWRVARELDAELLDALWYLRCTMRHLKRGPAGQERIYISGPYAADPPKKRDLHIQRAREAAAILLRKGHWPFCPHTMTAHFDEYFPDIPPMVYLAADLAWIPLCHSMLMLHGWRYSKGATAEHKAAERLGLTIYDDIRQVPQLSVRNTESKEGED